MLWLFLGASIHFCVGGHGLGLHTDRVCSFFFVFPGFVCMHWALAMGNQYCTYFVAHFLIGVTKLGCSN